jgi:hypothetical protein
MWLFVCAYMKAVIVHDLIKIPLISTKYSWWSYYYYRGKQLNWLEDKQKETIF